MLSKIHATRNNKKKQKQLFCKQITPYSKKLREIYGRNIESIKENKPSDLWKLKPPPNTDP